MDPLSEIISAVLLAEGDDAAAVAMVPDIGTMSQMSRSSQTAPSTAPASVPPAAAAVAEDFVVEGGEDAEGIERELTQLCIKESAAPEVFAYEDEVVGRAMRAMKKARKELAKRKSAAAAESEDDGVVDDAELTAVTAVVEMERARLKYLLAWYHRLRLEKIEGVLDVIVQEIDKAKNADPLEDSAADGKDEKEESEKLTRKLADAELEFAERLHDLRLRHMNRVFGSLLPKGYGVRGDEVCAHSERGERSLEDVKDSWDRNSVFVTIDGDSVTLNTDTMTASGLFVQPSLKIHCHCHCHF